MKTIELKLYKFTELSKEAKELALDKHRDINVSYDWWEDDGLLDVDQNIWCKKYGLKTCLFSWEKISFDGIDGSCRAYLQFHELTIQKAFASTPENSKGSTKKLVDNDEIFRQVLGIPKSLWNRISWNFIEEPGREKSTTIEFIIEDHEDKPSYAQELAETRKGERLFESDNKILDKAKEYFDSLVAQALKNLGKWYENLTSDEQVAETLENNEYDFTEEGERY